MSHHLLLTDWCLLAVIGFVAFVTLAGLRKPPTRRAFGRLLDKPLACSAGVIMGFFLVIAVLDSIPGTLPEPVSGGTVTQLDRVLYPLGQTWERTYSAPLALTLFTTEVVAENGKARQVLPRLEYPPKTLDAPGAISQAVSSAIGKGLGLGTMTLAGLWLFAVAVLSLRQRQAHPGLQPGIRAAIITVAVLVVLVCIGYALSRELHVFGTGKIGEDIFYQSVKSIRTGLVIGLLTTLFMMPLALAGGISAGYFGGKVDDAVQFVYTTLSSVPGVLLITASVLSLQTWIANHPEQFPTLADSADARLLALCLILGVTSWTGLCRLLRAETLKIREMEYVLAARSLGSSRFYILRKHLLPNVMHIVVITLALDFSFLVLAEAVLSYVGVGVSPMTYSWGNMINSARLELSREPVVWWPIMAAFSLMFLLVLAANLLADALRDAFDPGHA